MARTTRLTERDMSRLVRRIIKEDEYTQGPDEDYFEGQEDSRDLVSLVRDKLAALSNNNHKLKVLDAIKTLVDMELKVIERERNY
jgi:hypothetical protein